MKNIISLLLLAIICSAQTCSSQDEPNVVSKEYESCCGTKPVEFTSGKAYAYVPNVFTPNGDNVNDVFMPYVNEEVLEVRAFTILSAAGDTILFQRPSFNYKDIKEYAWNGIRSDGSRYTGIFNYKMQILNSERVLKIVEGQACVIQCGTDAKVFKSKDGCFYPAQAGKNGILDKSISIAEKDCF
jgi:hypothetical protein